MHASSTPSSPVYPVRLTMHLDTVELAELERERAALREPEPLQRPWALHCQERVLVGDVANIRAA